jgi:hypothetical protein
LQARLDNWSAGFEGGPPQQLRTVFTGMPLSPAAIVFMVSPPGLRLTDATAGGARRFAPADLPAV